MKWSNWTGQSNQKDFQPGLPRLFHRGNHICIAGNEDDAVDRSTLGKRRDIEADPHVDSFLLKHRCEVLVTESATVDWHRLGFPTPKSQRSPPYRKPLQFCEIGEPGVARLEVSEVTGHGLSDLTPELG
jgi:hypothetical protein